MPCSESAAGVRRPRVVIAEDFVLIQEAMRLLVERECDVVATVEDGQAALDAAREFNPEIVILDVSLPVIGGFEVAERLRENMPEVRVIFVTAHQEARYIQRAYEQGAWGYVLKGSMRSQLPLAIREAVAGRLYRPEQKTP